MVMVGGSTGVEGRSAGPLTVVLRTYDTRDLWVGVPRKPGLCLLPISPAISLVFTFGSFWYVTV